jgi:hypothetical protein
MSRLTGDTSIYLTRRSRQLPSLLASACIVVSMLAGADLMAQTSPAQSPSNATSTGAPDAASSDAQHIADIEKRLNDVTGALSETQQMLEKSLLEIQRLRAEVDALRAQTQAAAGTTGAPSTPVSVSPAASANGTPPKDDLKTLDEEVDALQSEIKQHEQIKVETVSKYPLRVTGLALFNAFSNAGVVDDVELPTFALPRTPGASHGSVGATLRQTLLALEATGPRLRGARSSADVSIDFFGNITSNSFGYNSPSGLVRLRQMQGSLDWDKTTVQAGLSGPLISPLSPTSFATVAQPALAGSGNLWTWSPQLRVEQRIPLPNQHIFGLEAGLLYPQSPGYTSTQFDSPVEAARRPGYEGRLSYRTHEAASGDTRPFALGVGGYSASQFYTSTTRVRSWAITGDWQIPFGARLELTGEVYRGSALGGLGGSAYKDILTGTDTVTGLMRTTGVDAVGGWNQLKLRLASTLEANATFGMDDALSRNFDGLILPTSTYPLELYSRNQSIVGNLIFRPKTYLILSPEYRRLLSWRYTGSANIANIFTLTMGYQF